MFHGNVKAVWARRLRADATTLLSASFDHPALVRGTHGGIPLIADLDTLDFDSRTGLIARLVDGLGEHRSARGIRHSVPSIVAMATAAALAGASKRDPLVGIAVVGKWLRGSGCDGADQVKLFSGMLHHNGAVIGQTQVGDDGSTCELNAMRPLLARLGDLTGKVITADALHCQRDHANAIVLDRHGHYLFGVKDNQPGCPHRDPSDPQPPVQSRTRDHQPRSRPNRSPLHRRRANTRRDLPPRRPNRARHP